MTRLVGVVLALLLTGCWWVGPQFYLPDAAAPRPFAAGRYELTVRDDDGKVTRSDAKMGYAKDGSLMDVAHPQSSDRTVIAPIADNLFVMQTMGDRPGDAVYGVIRRVSDAEWVGDMAIECAKTLSIAKAAGATIEQATDSSGKNRPICHFASRRSLEIALISYAASHPVYAVTFRRVGN